MPHKKEIRNYIEGMTKWECFIVIITARLLRLWRKYRNQFLFFIRFVFFTLILDIAFRKVPTGCWLALSGGLNLALVTQPWRTHRREPITQPRRWSGD